METNQKQMDEQVATTLKPCPSIGKVSGPANNILLLLLLTAHMSSLTGAQLGAGLRLRNARRPPYSADDRAIATPPKPSGPLNPPPPS